MPKKKKSFTKEEQKIWKSGFFAGLKRKPKKRLNSTFPKSNEHSNSINCKQKVKDNYERVMHEDYPKDFEDPFTEALLDTLEKQSYNKTK